MSTTQPYKVNKGFKLQSRGDNSIKHESCVDSCYSVKPKRKAQRTVELQ